MHFSCTFRHCPSEHLLSICNFLFSIGLFVAYLLRRKKYAKILFLVKIPVVFFGRPPQVCFEIWTHTFDKLYKYARFDCSGAVNIPVYFKWVVGNIHLRSIECNPESHLLVKSQVTTQKYYIFGIYGNMCSSDLEIVQCDLYTCLRAECQYFTLFDGDVRNNFPESQ